MSEDVYLDQFEQARVMAIQRLETMKPGRTCPCCGHINLPFIALQGCWCDPSTCEDDEHDHYIDRAIHHVDMEDS